MWLKGHGLADGVSDFQILKGLARNGTFCKLHCRKTNRIWWSCAVPQQPGQHPAQQVRADLVGVLPPPYKLKELFELGQKDAHAWCDKQRTPGAPGEGRFAKGHVIGGVEVVGRGR